ncbi:MAG TPA: hypothetical protein VI320_37145 [Terracidiphilus sp.]
MACILVNFAQGEALGQRAGMFERAVLVIFKSACVPGTLGNPLITIPADNDHVPLGEIVDSVSGFQRRVSANHYGPFRAAKLEGVHVADRKNAGKLLSFPAPAPVPGSSAEDWSRRILEIQDNLVSALEFVRFTYNEGLAGQPVNAAGEILAQVVTILRHDEKMPAYTVVGSIRIHGSISPEAKRKVLLLFPKV